MNKVISKVKNRISLLVGPVNQLAYQYCALPLSTSRGSEFMMANVKL